MKKNRQVADQIKTKVMGILNITPDSFYDGGIYTTNKEIMERVGVMIQEGADIIDIGACSTRPGSNLISFDEELSKLSDVMKLLKPVFPDTIFSIDTFRAGIARRMVEDFGVDMINDISAGDMDKDMFGTIADLKVPYIIMHMQGTPETMQENPEYKDVVSDIITIFEDKIKKLNRLGVKEVIIDPGFGFGKTLDHNYELMRNLESFKALDKLLMIGVSRKSMIGKLLGCEPKNALTGTIVLNTFALLKGVDILRVHDVKEAVEAIKIVEKLKQFVSSGS